MCERVALHRGYRNLPRTDYQDVVDDVNAQMCERLGPDHCTARKGDQWMHIKKDFSNGIDGETALAGSRALLDFLKSGRQMVEDAESLRRADICRSCHLNTPAQGCGNCSSLATATARLVPENRRYSGLNVCAACGCGLQLKVNVPLDIIEASEKHRDLTYPQNCWLHKPHDK